jgi:hypothetical protein
MGFHLTTIRACAGQEAKLLDGLSNSGPAVRLYREGRATGPPEDKSQQAIAKGKTMSAITQFVPAADLSFLTTDNKVSAFRTASLNNDSGSCSPRQCLLSLR